MPPCSLNSSSQATLTTVMMTDSVITTDSIVAFVEIAPITQDGQMPPCSLNSSLQATAAAVIMTDSLILMNPGFQAQVFCQAFAFPVCI